MASPSRKRGRLHLRSRGRDGDLLAQLVGEVRHHEKQLRADLKRADKALADQRTELASEREYSTKLKRERDSARAQLAEAAKEFDARKAEDEKELHRLSAAIADAQRIKNMERSSRDAAVRQQTLATAQRKVERIMRATAEGYREAFNVSGLEFDQDVEASDEEDRQSAPPDAVADTPQPPVCRSERSGSNDSAG